MHPTERFYEHLEVLLRALDNVEDFKTDLANALKKVEAYNWEGGEFEIEPHGSSGYDFSCRINSEFLLVFRRETDRDSQHQPLLVHLFLKTIERIKHS